MIKITIGVPVYNAEKYIKKALDSFVNQTMDKKEFEVLCVDDCSTDNSIEVINSYKDKLNITVLQLPQNSGGPGAPRNKVIEKANGEYIFFVDADDFIHVKSLEKMYEFASTNKSDILLVKLEGVNGRGVPQSMFKETNPNVDLYNSRIIYTLSPTKMFRTSLLRENNIYFPENLKSAEDQIFTMKAYLKANVISILSDHEYYYLTAHEGEHMSSAYVSPKDFYKVMSDILEEIYITSETLDRKNKLAIDFLNRHFNFSRTNRFTLRIKNQEKKEMWMEELHKFVSSSVPENIDSLTASNVYPRLILARNKDLANYERFESTIHSGDYEDYHATIENGQIFANFEFLSNYPNLNHLNFTKFNKLEHKLKNIYFDQDRITLTCHVHHTLLGSRENERQNVKAIFVHRSSKEEKWIPAIINHTKTQEYTFEIPFNGLILSKKDLGIWDLFIKSEIDGYSLKGRIGNNREPYQYQPETSLIGKNHLFNYRLTPYFTRPNDYFSIYTKELQSLEKDCNLKYNKKTGQLTIFYPDMHLILPNNTLFTFNIQSKEFVLPPTKILWETNGTSIIIESLLTKKVKDFAKLNFSMIKLNGIIMQFK